MSCICCGNCPPTISDPGPVCSTCIQTPSMIFDCASGFASCGDTLVVDLADYVVSTVCGDGGVTYSIYSVEETGVSATLDGSVITITSENYFEKNYLFKIVYKVACVEGISSGTGTIYVCMDSGTCNDGLNNCAPCTGNNLDVPSEFNMEAGDPGTVDPCGQDGILDLYSFIDLTECNSGDPEFSVVSASSAFEDVLISSGGILTYTSTSGATSGSTFPIVVKVSCPAYGISNEVTINVYIEDLCPPEVICAEGESCDPCTGDCISDGDVDLELS